MDRLHALELLVAVVETGSFTAAAARLNVTRGAISQGIKALEDELGVQLLNRTTRQVAATEEGRILHERGKQILADYQETAAMAAHLSDEPRGVLKINAPMSFGTLHLSPALSDFVAAHPQLRVQLSLTDRFVDLIEEGADVALRIGALEDSNLVARRIVTSRRLLCAAPDYLKRRGAPADPEALRDHSCLHYGHQAVAANWRLIGPEREHIVPVSGVLCANNGEVLRDAAISGLGIALLPTFIIGGALQSGQLVSVLPAYRPPEAGLYALYPHSRHLAARVRVFIDFMRARFGGRPYWDLVE
jgi:DNA-binding transcriptional LysR family regulator